MYIRRYKDERNNERLIKTELYNDRDQLVGKTAPRSRTANKRSYLYTYMCVYIFSLVT